MPSVRSRMTLGPMALSSIAAVATWTVPQPSMK